MKHSILFVVSKPDAIDYKTDKNWFDCVSTLSDLTNNNTGVVLLAENVLLIPLHENLSMLAAAVRVVTDLHYKYKYVIFDEEIIWHEPAKKP